MSGIRKISRRSFLGTVAGGAAIGALAITLGAAQAQAQVTDRDPYDPVGRGRGRRRRRSGITDRDPYDPVGNGRGRGRHRRRACTDSDSGRYADRAGNGRRC